MSSLQPLSPSLRTFLTGQPASDEAPKAAPSPEEALRQFLNQGGSAEAGTPPKSDSSFDRAKQQLFQQPAPTGPKSAQEYLAGQEPGRYVSAGAQPYNSQVDQSRINAEQNANMPKQQSAAVQPPAEQAGPPAPGGRMRIQVGSQVAENSYDPSGNLTESRNISDPNDKRAAAMRYLNGDSNGQSQQPGQRQGPKESLKNFLYGNASAQPGSGATGLPPGMTPDLDRYIQQSVDRYAPSYTGIVIGSPEEYAQRAQNIQIGQQRSAMAGDLMKNIISGGQASGLEGMRQGGETSRQQAELANRIAIKQMDLAGDKSRFGDAVLLKPDGSLRSADELRAIGKMREANRAFDAEQRRDLSGVPGDTTVPTGANTASPTAIRGSMADRMKQAVEGNVPAPKTSSQLMDEAQKERERLADQGDVDAVMNSAAPGGKFDPAALTKALVSSERVQGNPNMIAQRLANLNGGGGRDLIRKQLERELIRSLGESRGMGGTHDLPGGLRVQLTPGSSFWGDGKKASATISGPGDYSSQHDFNSDDTRYGDLIPTARESTKAGYEASAKALAPLIAAMSAKQ